MTKLMKKINGKYSVENCRNSLKAIGDFFVEVRSEFCRTLVSPSGPFHASENTVRSTKLLSVFKADEVFKHDGEIQSGRGSFLHIYVCF